MKLKNSNIMRGNKRISQELEKIDIGISIESVRKVISNFRKRGMVKKSHTWAKFLKSNWSTLFAMDSFTIDSITGKHFYILVVLELKTRKIIQFAITEHPVREFVRQQIIEFTNDIPGVKHLIHDRAPEFSHFNYLDYGIIAKKIL